MPDRFKLARDTLYSVTFHMAPRLASVVVFVLIGRWDGVPAAGIFALATSFLLIATTVLRGLDDLVVREVSRQPEQAGRYLLNFAVLRLVLTAMVFGLVFVAVRGLFQYPETTARTVLLLSLNVIPDGITFAAQAVLMGQRRFGTPALVLASVAVAKAVGGAVALAAGKGLEAVAMVWLAASTAGAVVLLVLAWRRAGGVRRGDWQGGTLLRAHARPALTFVLITLLLAFESQTDTLVLSKVRSEAEVGWYGAATTVAFGLVTLSQAYRYSVFPLMTRYGREAPEKLAQLYQQSLHLIAVAALPLTVGLLVTAPQVVALIFGPDFAPSTQPLQVLSLAFLVTFLNEPNARMMLVSDRQRQVVAILVVTTLTNITLNLLLVPRLGATGAALARLGSVAVLFGAYSFYVTYRLAPANMLNLMWRAVMASVVMGAVIWVIRDLPLLIVVPVGAAVYVILVIWLDRSLQDQVLGLWQRKKTPSNAK